MFFLCSRPPAPHPPHSAILTFGAPFPSLFVASRGLSAEPAENSRREDADANLPDSKVAYIARSKRDIAEHFGVAWSTMQPRLVGKVGSKVTTAHQSKVTSVYVE